MKFTNYEARGIYPLVSESPFMSWLYDIFSVYTFSVLLGVLLFAATISFRFTTPGVFDESVGGFPLLSLSGGFLVKDVALLGISAWTLADALRATRSSLGGSSQPHAT